MGGTGGDPRFKTLISVQATYPIYITPAGVLTCDDVIKVPLAYAVDRQTGIDHGAYRIIPVVELAIPLEFLVFEIITNEGVTVEPFSTLKLPDESNPYNKVRSYFALPSGTTGIKGVVFKPKYASTRVALQFGVLPPPYNYDTALFGVITSVVSGLADRIGTLEDKVNILKLTTKTPIFESIDLPKGAGKHTINIKDGVLFYNTSFSYPLSPNPTTRSPKITLYGGGRDQVYTLSLNKTINTVSIDLFTGMITVYAGVTGEIIQQFKLDLPYHGFETLSFEDFDDIDDSVLRVSAKGAHVE